jgi:hypothetical protein
MTLATWSARRIALLCAGWICLVGIFLLVQALVILRNVTGANIIVYGHVARADWLRLAAIALVPPLFLAMWWQLASRGRSSH